MSDVVFTHLGKQAVQNANTDFCMEAQTHRHRITRPVKRGHRCLFSLPPHLRLITAHLYARFVFVVVLPSEICVVLHVRMI